MSEDKQHVKYPKIRPLGSIETEGIFEGGVVYIQEKVDGANAQFQVVNSISPDIIFGSRNQKLDPKTGKFIFIPWVLENLEALMLNPDYIYYGESMQSHHVKYTDAPPFVGFDILDKPSGEFLEWGVTEAEFKKLGIPTTPTLAVVDIGKGDTSLAYLKGLVARKSSFGGHREGITIKNYGQYNKWGRPLFAKIVSDEFKEIQPQRRERVHVRDEVIEGLVDQYCTPARIRKHIHNHEDLNGPVEMKDMPILHRVVADDIIDESDNGGKLTPARLKMLYTKVAAVTAKQLKQHIMERA